MEHVNLSGAQIREATLSGAHLGFANLREANLFESDLSPLGPLHTDLSGADLDRRKLEGQQMPWGCDERGSFSWDRIFWDRTLGRLIEQRQTF